MYQYHDLLYQPWKMINVDEIQRKNAIEGIDADGKQYLIYSLHEDILEKLIYLQNDLNRKYKQLIEAKNQNDEIVKLVSQFFQLSSGEKMEDKDVERVINKLTKKVERLEQEVEKLKKDKVVSIPTVFTNDPSKIPAKIPSINISACSKCGIQLLPKHYNVYRCPITDCPIRL